MKLKVSRYINILEEMGKAQIRSTGSTNITNNSSNTVERLISLEPQFSDEFSILTEAVFLPGVSSSTTPGLYILKEFKDPELLASRVTLFLITRTGDCQQMSSTWGKMGWAGQMYDDIQRCQSLPEMLEIEQERLEILITAQEFETERLRAQWSTVLKRLQKINTQGQL